MKNYIQVIEDNSGGITIQDIKDEICSFYEDIHFAKDDLQKILDGEDLSGWDLSDNDFLISDEEFKKHESSGGYKLLTAEEIEEKINN